MTANENEAFDTAAKWLSEADGLLVTAGAGMGVDSGLPDFRGRDGFWRAYPVLRTQGLRFEDMANPAAFRRAPVQTWGFYGHRLNLYRETVPHRGFKILNRWGDRMEHGAFVYTSNIDGQFQKAGFGDRVVECHGSIHWLQCTEQDCKAEIWSADTLHPQVDAILCLLISPLPRCPHCAALARPNILLFDDYDWVEERLNWQQRWFDGWFATLRQPVVIELGAGRAIPTVRHFSERHGPRVIRINPRESAINLRIGIGIADTALNALQRLDTRLGAAWGGHDAA